MSGKPDGIDGEAGHINEFGNRLHAAKIATARAAVTGAAGGACAAALPGCAAYTTAVAAAATSLGRYLDEVGTGFTAYSGIARNSAADYLGSDGTGRGALLRALEARPNLS